MAKKIVVVNAGPRKHTQGSKALITEVKNCFYMKDMIIVIMSFIFSGYKD